MILHAFTDERGSPQKEQGDIGGLESIIHDKSQSTKTKVVNCCKISFRTILYVHHVGIMTTKLSGKCTLIIGWNLRGFFIFKVAL